MKKTYQKPVVAARALLSTVTAGGGSAPVAKIAPGD